MLRGEGVGGCCRGDEGIQRRRPGASSKRPRASSTTPRFSTGSDPGPRQQQIGRKNAEQCAANEESEIMNYE